MQTLLHASCVAIDGVAVLLRGPSGSGKSDLALRLIDCGARLVADDQVALGTENGRLIARAPAALAGLLEVRGIGIVRIPPAESAPVVLIIDLDQDGQIERLPELENIEFQGVSVRRLILKPFEASAAAKVRVAVGHARHSL